MKKVNKRSFVDGLSSQERNEQLQQILGGTGDPGELVSTSLTRAGRCRFKSVNWLDSDRGFKTNQALSWDDRAVLAVSVDRGSITCLTRRSFTKSSAGGSTIVMKVKTVIIELKHPANPQKLFFISSSCFLECSITTGIQGCCITKFWLRFVVVPSRDLVISLRWCRLECCSVRYRAGYLVSFYQRSLNNV